MKEGKFSLHYDIFEEKINNRVTNFTELENVVVSSFLRVSGGGSGGGQLSHNLSVTSDNSGEST